MAKSSRLRKDTPGMREVLQQDLNKTTGWLSEVLRLITNWLFAYDQRSAHRRLLIFILSTLLIWFLLALTLILSNSFDQLVLSELLGSFFSIRILRHFLALALAMGLALIIAAVYLDDIFELDNLPIAELFLLEAAFALFYRRITIRNGNIGREHLNSPIVQIGGPGTVDVHLENAALLEKVDGSSRVAGPTTNRPLVLDGFERIRQVVDLRDQVVEMTVSGRTQDGIPITAKDVRLVFSIYRGQSRVNPNEAFIQPYPFSEEAVYNLVYQQEPGPWIEGMRQMICRELIQFISQHTLSEFLTTANIDIQVSSLVPREELSDLFFDFASGFSERARERGVELQWIGVGTWVLPAQLIPEHHMEAWRLSFETRARKSSYPLTRMREENRIAELVNLVDEIPTVYYSLLKQEMPADLIRQTLIQQYREKIWATIKLYSSQGQPVPVDLQAAADHLDHLVKATDRELD
jgi:hypothetical protein